MENTNQSGLRERVQKFGRFLSAMVMPNIGAFIAWGIITALFIPTGWMPNEQMSTLVGPMITYMLPLLIGYTGGQLVDGKRGGVLGAIATMGVIVGADIPMFIGAMIMGPLGGFAIKKVDALFEDNIPAGFEMLVANFSAGITGMFLALLAYVVIGPVVLAFNTALGAGVKVIVEMGLLPLASILIEPAKILFLNNAINHGVLGPLGVQETAELGKSIFFLLETNPGPGLGILMAYWVFSKGMIKQSAPGAIIIHFLGGIHEIYFPYILMKPILLVAVILGGMSGVFTFSMFGVGLAATPSPGSIFALLALTPKGNFLGVIAGVLVSSIVTFLVAGIFLRGQEEEEMNLEDAKEKVVTMKAKKKSISTIVFACDAGMGSSAMGASILERKLKEKNIHLTVKNESVDSISPDADLVISYKTLEDRVRSSAPSADYIGIDDFVDKAVYADIVEKIQSQYVIESVVKVDDKPAGILMKQNILMGLASESKSDAIKRAGQTLVDSGYVGEAYIEGMLAREEKFTTYIGNNVAIPHGENAVKDAIKESGLVVLQYPEGVDFGDGNVAYILVGIAGKGNEHIMLLANIAEAIEEPEVVEQLKSTKDQDYIYNLFAQEEM